MEQRSTWQWLKRAECEPWKTVDSGWIIEPVKWQTHTHTLVSLCVLSNHSNLTVQWCVFSGDNITDSAISCSKIQKHIRCAFLLYILCNFKLCKRQSFHSNWMLLHFICKQNRDQNTAVNVYKGTKPNRWVLQGLISDILSPAVLVMVQWKANLTP